MGRNNFTMNEISIGVVRLGTPGNRQILVQGNAERPVVTGDLNLSVQPSNRLTIINNTAYNDQRISGPSSYTESKMGQRGETINSRLHTNGW
jgi:hypothetical protein